MDFNTACKKVYEIFNKLDPEVIKHMTHYIHTSDEIRNEYVDEIENALTGIAEFYWIDNGCTKLVIRFKNIPEYVVKVPFFSEYVLDEYDDYYDFSGACIYTKLFGTLGNQKDYCLLESLIYKIAVSYGLSDLFAETSYAFTIYDVPVYLSTYIDDNYSLYRGKNYLSEEDETTIKNITKSYQGTPAQYVDKNVCKRIFEDYGEEMLNIFLNFSKVLLIEDVHNDNVGKNKGGKFCILDYSGYNE